MSERRGRFAASFGEALRAGAEALGLGEVALGYQERFTTLALAVLAANAAAGLTAIDDPADVAIKHFLDSLACLRSGVWRGARTAVDVGSGGGFPGLALAVALPEVRFTLVEASAKKAAFLTRASEAVGRRTTVRHIRAEDFGRAGGGPGRDRFDVGLARATAPLAVSCEYVLPLVRPGGHYLAQLGPRVGRRLAVYRGQGAGDGESSPPWRVLGGELTNVEHLTLPAGRGARYLAEFAKVAPTPPKYPRKAGTPSRSPLRGFHV